MADPETITLLRWLETLPLPRDDSAWDAIFLLPEGQCGFEEHIAWYWRTFIHPEGDLHEEFMRGRL